MGKSRVNSSSENATFAKIDNIQSLKAAALRYRNVKGVNQVIQRFSEIFPKAKRGKNHANQVVLRGIACAEGNCLNGCEIDGVDVSANYALVLDCSAFVASEVSQDKDSDPNNCPRTALEQPSLAMAEYEGVKIGDKILDVINGFIGVVTGLTTERVIYQCRSWGEISRHRDLVTVLIGC